MSIITIDQAVFEDIPDMMKLLEELFRIEKDFEPHPERQQKGLALLFQHPESVQVFVARDEMGKTVGMCSVQLVISTAQGSYAAWIEDVIVHHSVRKQGIASRLLQAASHWAKAQGATRLQLLVDLHNLPALQFYQRQGWKVTQLQARHYFLTTDDAG
jgi:GNAT superfamily N-acetyltransferase